MAVGSIDRRVISIIIPAFNAASTIEAQLEALSRQHHTVDCEIVVADNGSTDDTRARVARWSERLPLRVADASARPGPAAARNLGVEASTGDLLLFVDADDVVLPGWLAAWAEHDGSIDAGGGPVVFFSGDDPPDDPRGVASGLPVHMGYLPYALGANLGVRRACFETVGGFPEERDTAEDVVLSWRLQRAGVSLRYVPSAVVAKRRAPTSRDTVRQYYRYGRSDPYLYREFRTAGLAHAPVGATLKSYLGIVARLPLLFDDAQRSRWSAQAGRRAGRLAGSVRAHTFYP